MTLDFVQPITTIGGDSTENATPLQFYKSGFFLNCSHTPQYQDVTVSGENYVNLVNAKANGLNYVKAFG